jgi:hypothetical protein
MTNGVFVGSGHMPMARGYTYGSGGRAGGGHTLGSGGRSGPGGVIGTGHRRGIGSIGSGN